VFHGKVEQSSSGFTIGQRRRQLNEREKEKLSFFRRYLSPYVQACFKVIGRKRGKISVVGVEHDVSTQINKFDEELLPRVSPSIGAYAWDYWFLGIVVVVIGIDGCETTREVVMEFTPVLRKIDCTPAAGNGGEIWSINWDICFSVRRKESSGVERLSAL